MKIAILGTRGIPNQYGGFEECAMHLSRIWVGKGHEVRVYNSSLHPFKEDSWNGVEIRRIKDREERLGTIAQFFYDLACISDVRKQPFDIILQLGYTSSGVWQWYLPSKPRVVTNTDGLEWKREKYSRLVQRFLKWSERLAVRRAHQVVADSPVIQSYLDSAYGSGSVYIPYGAEIPENPSPEILKSYPVKSGQYHLIMARMEPENKIHDILEGLLASNDDTPTLVVGHRQTAYGSYIQKHFKSAKVHFLPGVYDRQEADSLRFFSRRYFHGHSAGGTNPSLLQAMACNCLIYAHDNAFNRYVLGENAHFFSGPNDIVSHLTNPIPPQESAVWKRNNLKRIRREYQWESVAEQYEVLFQQALI